MSHKDERAEGRKEKELSGDERCADLLLSIHDSFSTAGGCRDAGARCKGKKKGNEKEKKVSEKNVHDLLMG